MIKDRVWMAEEENSWMRCEVLRGAGALRPSAQPDLPVPNPSNFTVSRVTKSRLPQI